MSGNAADAAPALDDAILIVAHPDDEVLWFGSILRQVARVIVAFRDFDAVPELGRRRAAAMAELPYRNLRCLDLAEAGTLRRADWDRPTLTEYGIALDASGASPCADETVRRYVANFAVLCARLRPELTAGVPVFTHNPWGEYGHEDHVQVHCAVERLRREIGFPLWTTNYVGARSTRLARRHAGHRSTRLIRRDIDLDYAGRIAGIYRRHDCWTWPAAWTGCREEYLVSLPLLYCDAAAGGGDIPLNHLGDDV